MDRKSITGFVLLIVLAIGYMFYSNHEADKYEAIRAQQVADSMALVKAQTPKVEAVQAVATIDSSLPSAYQQVASQVIPFTNGKVTLGVTTKGAFPVSAQLNDFKTYEQEDMFLWKDDKQNRLAFKLPIDGKEIWSDELNFTPEQHTTADGTQQLIMTADLGNNQKVILTYALAKDSYMMEASLRVVGLADGLTKVSEIPVEWKTAALHTEKDLKNERMAAQMHFRDGSLDHDYFTIARTDNYTIKDGVNWITVKVPFFNSTIVANGENFTKGSYTASEPKEDSSVVVNSAVSLAIPAKASNDFNFNFKWYIGPNDYNVLKSYKIDFEEIIPLGTGLFFFVKYIAKWFIIPIFNFLSQFISNFGILIIVLTLIIRTFLSFFTYKSQLSAAKMRVLKPEIDQLKEKYGDDQQAMGMEQMKLYRTAGVNPLGGCLPMFIQLPFLLAMYYFFPTAIQLRQAHFLWSNDLSTYDNIMNLPFNIPFYGDHVSLFTLLMTITSLLLAVYNKNMTAGQDMNNPNMQMMKYMPYIMPIMFLGWFNNFAAGLTFYYTFSNILSIVQQFVITKFFINEEKILAQMEENKNKPAGTSKWQQKLEEMQKMQQERMKNQGK